MLQVLRKLKSLAYFSIWYDEEEKEEVETTGKVIQLNDNIGLMRKAKQTAVLRYHKTIRTETARRILLPPNSSLSAMDKWTDAP